MMIGRIEWERLDGRRITNNMIRIKERSYTEEDIPESFYLVTHYPRSLGIPELKARVLDGITGISESGLILLDFFMVARNMVLKLNGPDTVRINQLSRVMYDNPHYLVSNNLYALSRVYQKEYMWNRGEYNALMQNFLRMLVKSLGAKGPAAESIYMKPSFAAREVKPQRVHDVPSFIRYLKRLFASVDDERFNAVMEDISDEELEQGVYHALERIGEIYGSEGEWVVKDKELKIPASFEVILATHSMYEDWKADSLNQSQLINMKMSDLEDTLKETAELENFCEEQGIPFHPVDAKQFENFRDNLLNAKNVSRIDKLKQRYSFL